MILLSTICALLLWACLWLAQSRHRDRMALWSLARAVIAAEGARKDAGEHWSRSWDQLAMEEAQRIIEDAQEGRL